MKKYVKSDYTDLDRLDSINYQNEKELENIKNDVTDAVRDVMEKYINHFGSKTQDGMPDDFHVTQNYVNTLSDLEDVVVEYIANVCKF